MKFGKAHKFIAQQPGEDNAISKVTPRVHINQHCGAKTRCMAPEPQHPRLFSGLHSHVHMYIHTGNIKKSCCTYT